MCVHHVELVDDCPECMRLFRLRRRVESLQKELSEAKRDLSIAKTEQKKKVSCVYNISVSEYEG